MIELLNYLAKNGITMNCIPSGVILYDEDVIVYKFVFVFPNRKKYSVLVRSDSPHAECDESLLDILLIEIKEAVKQYNE